MKKKNEEEFHLSIIGSVEHLLDFLDLEIEVLDTKVKFPSASSTDTSHEIVVQSSDFTWTDNKTHLVEILGSILYLGSINNGKVVKSHFMRHIGNALNVDLENHSGLLNDMLNRYDDPDIENARIYYLKDMLEALFNRLNELDKNKRRNR